MRPLSTVARGGTVAASGLLCHATIAEQQLARRKIPSPPGTQAAKAALDLFLLPWGELGSYLTWPTTSYFPIDLILLNPSSSIAGHQSLCCVLIFIKVHVTKTSITGLRLYIAVPPVRSQLPQENPDIYRILVSIQFLARVCPEIGDMQSLLVSP